MTKTPASIEHDGDGNDAVEKVRRLQRGSWPRGQGEAEIRIQGFEIRRSTGPPGSAGSKLLEDKERAQAEAYATKA
jgi:hypothetical protein